MFNFKSESSRAYLFIAPALFLITLFGIFPIFYAFYISLHKWKIHKVEFKGFDNYLKLLGDPLYAFYFFSGLCALRLCLTGNPGLEFSPRKTIVWLRSINV